MVHNIKILLHNNNMQSITLIIVVFFLLIIVSPMFVKAHVSYDFLNNLGAVSLYIFFIKICAFKIKIKNKNIVLISEKKEKVIEQEISEKQMRFLEQLTVQLKQKIIIRKIYAFSRIGVGEADKSAILSGLISAIICSFFAKIKNTKKSATIGVFSEPAFNEEHFTIALYGSFMITIFDIIYAFVLSLLLIKRREKYERI